MHLDHGLALYELVDLNTARKEKDKMRKKGLALYELVDLNWLSSCLCNSKLCLALYELV